MKKIFTSFLTLLLLMVASNAMAQYKPTEAAVPQDGESYLLSTSVDGTDYFVTYKGGMQTTTDDASFLWQLEDAGDGNFYIKSVDTGKYIQEYDQEKLSIDQGGYPYDGYDLYGYAGFNFDMGEKSGAMKMTITGEAGANVVQRTKTVPAMSSYGYDVFKLEYQTSSGVVNVAMDPWGSGHTWTFYQYEGKSVQDQLVDLITRLDYESYPAGTTFGFYDADKVAAYEAVREEARSKVEDPEFNDFQTLFDKLTSAYEAVKGSMIRLSEGYYRIASGFTSFTDQQGEDAIKTMYDNDGTGYWKNLDKEDATMLWKITPDASDSDLYDVVNAYTGRHYTNVTTSSTVSLTADEDGVKTYITVAGYQDNVTKADIRPSTSPAGGSRFIHCGGHSSGAGVSGQLVGWYTTFENSKAGASEWEFLSVSADEAKAIIDAQSAKDNKGAILDSLRSYISKGEARYYASGSYTQGEALIKNVEQFSSNATEPSEGALDYLIDGDATTYWHSNWSDGSVPGDSHYLQVDLINPVDQAIELYVKRRAATDDHVTVTTIYGSNDGENWTWVNRLELGNATSGAEYTTQPFETCGFRYLRFWTTDTYYSGGSTRGYCHYAEFQLYPVTLNEGCQLDKIKDTDVAKNLKSAITTARGNAEPTLDDVATLKAAYEAFCAISSDPTELNSAIASAEEELAGWTIGTNPGYLSQESADALQAAIDAAKAVLAKESYTQAELDAQTSALNAVVESITAIKPDPSKWYNITWVYDGVTYYACTQNDSETATSDDLVKINTEAAVSNPQMAQWRFIPDGKGFLIQNRATGMCIRTISTQQYGYTTFQSPSNFRFAYTGTGSQALYSTAFSGAVHGYMVVYGSDLSDLTIGSYGTSGYNAFNITEVEATDESTLTANDSIVNNAFEVFVSPFDITTIGGEGALAYNLVGINYNDGTMSILLNETTSAEAGTPVIVFSGSEQADVVADNKVAIKLTFGNTYAPEAKTTETGLVGTYKATTAPAGTVVIKNGRFAPANEDTDISAFTGYCNIVSTTQTEVDNTIEIEAPTGINAALASVAKRGNIYNAAGQFVGNGNISNLKNMGRGMYIINGVKVMVK